MPGPIRQASRPGWLIGKPEIADVDGDGTPDLVATMVFHEYPAEVQQRLGKRPRPWTPTFSRRIVQAVSGRSGRCLWTYAIDPKFTLIKTQYWDRPAALVRGKKLMSIAIIDGTEWTPLDPATGRPRSGTGRAGLRRLFAPSSMPTLTAMTTPRSCSLRKYRQAVRPDP